MMAQIARVFGQDTSSGLGGWRPPHAHSSNGGTPATAYQGGRVCPSRAHASPDVGALGDHSSSPEQQRAANATTRLARRSAPRMAHRPVGPRARGSQVSQARTLPTAAACAGPSLPGGCIVVRTGGVAAPDCSRSWVAPRKRAREPAQRRRVRNAKLHGAGTRVALLAGSRIAPGGPACSPAGPGRGVQNVRAPSRARLPALVRRDRDASAHQAASLSLSRLNVLNVFDRGPFAAGRRWQRRSCRRDLHSELPMYASRMGWRPGSARLTSATSSFGREWRVE